MASLSSEKIQGVKQKTQGRKEAQGDHIARVIRMRKTAQDIFLNGLVKVKNRMKEGCAAIPRCVAGIATDEKGWNGVQGKKKPGTGDRP